MSGATASVRSSGANTLPAGKQVGRSVPSGVVVVANLDEDLRTKWLSFLIENDNIRFDCVSDDVYSAQVRLFKPQSNRSNAESSLQRITSALKTVSLHESQGKPLPPYARFCALLTEPEGAQDYASSSSNSKTGQPRKRAVQWVERKAEEIIDAKEAALRIEAGESGESLSLSNIFPVFAFEHLNERFGLRALVEQTGWDLVYSLHRHRRSSPWLETFARFLEETFDGDDLLFYLHARDVASRHKLGGLDAPFERLGEVALFSSIAHGSAESLKRAFAERAERELAFPCSAHAVLLLAVDNYHSAANAAPVSTSSSALVVAVAPLPGTPPPPPLPRPNIRPEDVSALVRQREARREEDDRPLEEIVQVQDRIRRQLDAVLSAPSEFASSPRPPPPSSSRGNRRQSRAPPPLPLIHTGRSPESSSVSSASPRSHPSFASPAHHQQHLHQQQIQSQVGVSPSRQSASMRGSFFAADTPLMSEIEIIDAESSAKAASETKPRRDPPHEGRKAELSEETASRAEASEQPDKHVEADATFDVEDRNDNGTNQKARSGAEEKTVIPASPPSGEGPAMALQRAVARLGSQMLDRFVSSQRASGVGGGVSSSPTFTERAALRRRAFEVFNKRALKITEQVQAHSHTHSVALDCSPTYCPYSELRQLYQRVVKLYQARKPMDSEVNELAGRIIGSSMVTREMDALKDSLAAEAVTRTEED